MQKKSNKLWWGLFAGLVLVCFLAAMTAGLWQIFTLARDSATISSLLDSGETATPTPVPLIERTPLPAPPDAAATPVLAQSTPTIASLESESGSEPEVVQASPLQLSTEQALLQSVLPERDQRLLASRLKHQGAEIPRVVPDSRNNFQVEDTDSFWVTDNSQLPPRQFEVQATLRYVTAHSYWWVEKGFSVTEDDLRRSAERFENQTYPTNRAFFGSEWTPGVDNDVRVHIFMGNVPGVAGYFSASNSYARLAEPYSNQREIFFINLNAISPGNDYFDGVLAHEFQHMIHWHQDRNEDTWINEGMSELATFINGYGLSGFVGAYSHAPDTQLNSWSSSPGSSLAHYGGSFLFMAYFLQRYGEEMTQAVVANPNNGIAGFNAVLAEHGYSEQFEDIFADFLVANILNDPVLNDEIWGYKDLAISTVTLSERYSVYPVEQQTTVYQYGGDYIELTGNGDISIEFTGSTRVKVVDNEPYSGAYQWYSHRGDETNTRLTRAFDLTNVPAATLNYWTWYDLEADWDYGYVEISTDGGQTWTVLQAPHSATTNPSGNAFGPGYTGVSGGGPDWVEESIDLSAYTGQEVLIRFETVTDDAVNRPGWTLDDISIPEIGFFDDVESGLNGWQAEGFVRIDNSLPQRFLAHLLEFSDEITLRPIPLDETNHGTITIEGFGAGVERAILIVSGLTPVTTQPASYEYRISEN